MIKILCFSYLKEQFGTGEIILEDTSLDVKELLQNLEEKFGFKLNSIMVAINEEYAVANDRIHSGDVVALIPPVSGG